MAKAGRLEWVDTGRGIAISLVALFHSTNWLYGTGLNFEVWTNVSIVLSSLRMPLFFTLSGLFAAKWLTASWGSLLRTKVVLFAWVLIVWSIIGMIVQVTALHVAGQPVAITSAVRDLLLVPIKPLFELWFIWALALFFVIAKATRRVPIVVQLAVTGIVSAVGLTIWLNTTTGLTGSAKFYFFFLGGLYLRSVIVSFSSARPLVRWTVLTVWAAVSVTLFVFGLRGLPAVYFLNCVLGVFAGVALSRLLSRVGLLRRLGTQTLPIYLAHTPIAILIAIVIMITPPLLVAASAISGVLPPLVAALAVAGALGVHGLAQRSWLRYLYAPPPATIRMLGGPD